MYKLLVQRQYAFPSIAYSAWISRKGATRLIADGEIEDVAHNVGGFAHGLDAVDAHRPSAVVFIEIGYAHILLQISQDASECRRLIVGRIFRRNEKHCHVPLLQHDFLNAETAGKPAQRDHKNQFARLVGNRSETVFKSFAEGVDILLPLHVVLLEVLIDPTCSIVLERQPAETDIMERRPRDPKETLLTTKLLVKSVLQGLTIFAASFGAYFVTLGGNPENAPVARAMGLAIIMISNLFLVQVNSSDHDYAYLSAARLIKDKVMWAVNIGALALIAVILYTPVSALLNLSSLSLGQILIVFGLAAISVFWYEIVKLFQKLSNRTGKMNK